MRCEYLRYLTVLYLRRNLETTLVNSILACLTTCTHIHTQSFRSSALLSTAIWKALCRWKGQGANVSLDASHNGIYPIRSRHSVLKGDRRLSPKPVQCKEAQAKPSVQCKEARLTNAAVAREGKVAGRTTTRNCMHDPSFRGGYEPGYHHHVNAGRQAPRWPHMHRVYSTSASCLEPLQCFHGVPGTNFSSSFTDGS